MGIKKYNEACRGIVMRFAAEWEKTVTRLGRWIDFKNDYKVFSFFLPFFFPSSRKRIFLPLFLSSSPFLSSL